MAAKSRGLNPSNGSTLLYLPRVLLYKGLSSRFEIWRDFFVYLEGVKKEG